jgi:hypothetical protein
VASEGEEWKKYRKIAAPAFSEVCPEHCSSPNPEYCLQKNNKLVWDETIRIMVDMFENVWGDKSEVVVDHCVDVTLPVCSLWHRFYPCHNTIRLPSSSLVSQVGYARSSCGSLMTTDTRIWPSDDMDSRPRCSCWPPNDIQGCPPHFDF